MEAGTTQGGGGRTEIRELGTGKSRKGKEGGKKQGEISWGTYGKSSEGVWEIVI